MKLKLTGDRRATDARIALTGVPFDASRRDVVQAALMTLGSTIDEVADIVTLTRRTNQAMYFDMEGSDSVLEPFFKRFYNHMTFDEVKNKFGRANVETKDEKNKRKAKEKAAREAKRLKNISDKNAEQKELAKVAKPTTKEVDPALKDEKEKMDKAAKKKAWEAAKKRDTKKREITVEDEDAFLNETIEFFKTIEPTIKGVTFNEGEGIVVIQTAGDSNLSTKLVKSYGNRMIDFFDTKGYDFVKMSKAGYGKKNQKLTAPDPKLKIYIKKI